MFRVFLLKTRPHHPSALCRREGLKGLFRGGLTSILGVIPFEGVQVGAGHLLSQLLQADNCHLSPFFFRVVSLERESFPVRRVRVHQGLLQGAPGAPMALAQAQGGVLISTKFQDLKKLTPAIPYQPRRTILIAVTTLYLIFLLTHTPPKDDLAPIDYLVIGSLAGATGQA